MKDLEDFLAMSDTDRLKELVYLLESGIEGDIDYFIYRIKQEVESREKCSSPDRHDIEARILHIIQDEYDYDATSQSVLGKDTYFDSLDALEFAMYLEKEFNISIPDADIWSFDKPTKVKEVIDYIIKRLEKKL